MLFRKINQSVNEYEVNAEGVFQTNFITYLCMLTFDDEMKGIYWLKLLFYNLLLYILLIWHTLLELI